MTLLRAPRFLEPRLLAARVLAARVLAARGTALGFLGRGFSSAGFLVSCFLVLGLSSACSSNTTKQIVAFSDKICACQDAACATAVQTEYLAWWKANQRARGSEGDRKDIEKAMQRYAECHARLVGEESEGAAALQVPSVDLRAPAAAPAPGMALERQVAPGGESASDPSASEESDEGQAETEGAPSAGTDPLSNQ